MLYLFHNYVNKKKRKSLFNYDYLNKYSNLNLGVVVKNFIEKYNTKGNMNLLTETFQRTLVIRDFIKWIKIYSRAFIQPIMIIKNNPTQTIKPIKEEQNAIEQQDTITQDTN